MGGIIQDIKVYMTDFFFICLIKSTWYADANIEKRNSKSRFFTAFST